MKQADLDYLVLQYLKKRGLSQAEQIFKQESHLQEEEEMALVHQLDTEQGIVQNLLFYNAADNDPEQYLVSFDRLAAWVDNSLDMFKGDLVRILYPVFVHVYLQLVSVGASALANELVRKHRSHLLNLVPGSRQLQSRLQELQELTSVVVPHHLETHRLAKTLRSRRRTVKLCGYSFQLLMNFLQGAQLWLLLSIVNEHIKLEVAEGRPSGLEDEGMPEDELIAGDAATSGGLPLVQLSLLQDWLEDKYSNKQLAKDDGEPQPSGKEEEGGVPGQASKRQRRDHGGDRRGTDAEQARRQEVLASRVAPCVPLPPYPAGSDQLMEGHIGNRALVDADHLPSCCFFTFTNTRESLNCVATSADAAQVAGGFADSSLRLYNLQHIINTRRAKARRLQRERERGQAAEDDEDEDDDDDDDDDENDEKAVEYCWGHEGPVYAVDYSPEGHFLLSGGEDGTVRLWSKKLAAGLVAFRGHVYPVWDVATCPRGWYFASSGADHTARMWCTERLQTLRMFVGHQSDVDVVRWHPNCHYLATGSSDHTVRLWDINEGKSVRQLLGHTSGITSLAFSPDGSLLVSGSEDGSLCCWDLAAGKKMVTRPGHDGPIWSLAFSQGPGTLVASGGADATVRLWSMPPGDASLLCLPPQPARKAPRSDICTPLKAYRTKATPVYEVAFTPGNLLLASGAVMARRKGGNTGHAFTGR